MNQQRNSQYSDLGMTLGMLLLRIWLSVRAIQTGLEKFAGSTTNSKTVTIDGTPNDYGLTETTSSKVYAISNYQGVPGPLYDKFLNEPLIPTWGLDLYNLTLGPALIIFGLSLLLGICTRISLFAMGIIYTTLTFGLILIKQDAGIAWLGIHVIMVVLALSLAKYNRLTLIRYL